jgi:hypothetical protein
VQVQVMRTQIAEIAAHMIPVAKIQPALHQSKDVLRMCLLNCVRR